MSTSSSLSGGSDAEMDSPRLPQRQPGTAELGSAAAAAAAAAVAARGRGRNSSSSEDRGSSGSEGSSSSGVSDSSEDKASSSEGGSGGSQPDEGDVEDGGLAWELGGAADDEGGEEGGGLPAGLLERLRLLMAMRGAGPPSPPVQRPPLLSSFDLRGVAELIRSGGARRIICMCGAGISVSAGIPDFRSPGTGLYHRLEHFGLPHPEAVFELEYFKVNPRPFFLLAKELFPGVWRPTPAHYFMRLLHDKGLLLRCYTQNIDSLEHQAGLPRSTVVAAHGNFDSAHCIRCGLRHSVAHVRRAVFRGDGHPCFCKRKGCGGLVKPDIVFFGEPLPRRFFESVPQDFPQADLLVVMGSSLVVHPFASLIDEVGEDTPRLLINRERAGEGHPLLRMLGYSSGGFCFDEGSNYRDAFFQGDCDDGVRQLCRLLGWEAELDALIAAGPCPPSPELSEAGASSGSEGEDEEGLHHRLSRAHRRRQLRLAVGSMLALPGRRARRLLQIRLLHYHARQQRRRLRQVVRQMGGLHLQEDGGGA